MNYRLFFILIFLTSCKSYIILEKPDIQDYPIAEIPKYKNIALVGLESYKYHIDGKSSLDYILRVPMENLENVILITIY